jgi:hypothetical protein
MNTLRPMRVFSPPVVKNGEINEKFSSTLYPTRSLNTARISSAWFMVKRLSSGVIAIARLVLATMAAGSGVPRG